MIGNMPLFEDDYCEHMTDKLNILKLNKNNEKRNSNTSINFDNYSQDIN